MSWTKHLFDDKEERPHDNQVHHHTAPMSVGAAAKVLGVGPSRIHQLATRGEIPELPTAAMTLGGRMFLEDDVRELARRRAALAQHQPQIKVPPSI